MVGAIDYKTHIVLQIQNKLCIKNTNFDKIHGEKK